MSHMKNLAIEIDNAGIDYREVDLETVDAYRAKRQLVIYDSFKAKYDIHEITPIQAIRELYGKGGLCRTEHTSQAHVMK